MATDKPWPNDPDAILIPSSFSWVVGWPCNLLFSFLNVESSLISKYPDLAKTE